MADILKGLEEHFDFKVSRNALIGKINRMKLADRPKTNTAKKLAKQPKPWFGFDDGQPAPPKRSREKPPRPIGGDRLYVNGRPVPRAPSSVDLPQEEGGVLMSEHSKLTCHWPVGTSEDGEMKMCGGALEHGAYCAAHAARAYYKPPTKKRQEAFWR